MPRYVIANNISGVVRGVATAADPVSACRQLDARLGDGDRMYEEHDARSRSAHATANAYAVYEATAELSPLAELPGITVAQINGLTKVAVVVVRE